MPRSRTKHTPPKDGEGEGDLAYYMAEARKHKVMSADEERALARQAQVSGPEGAEARNEFVCRNMRLVVSIARQYKSTNVPLPDLVQEGCIGLLRAIEKFDPDRGFKFSTYASWWVRQAVTRTIHQSDHIKLPLHVVESRRQVLLAERALGSEGRQVSEEELSALTGLSRAKVRNLRALPSAGASLDAPFVNGEGSLIDVIADEANKDLDFELENEQFRALVEKALEEFVPRDRELLLAWVGGENPSLETLGRQAGVTRERVRQILQRIFRQLRAQVDP
jgi:RNA polymerase sigma factor (sigma-70 family)